MNYFYSALGTYISASDLYTTGKKFCGSMLSSVWAFSRFLSKASTLPMLNQIVFPYE